MHLARLFDHFKHRRLYKLTEVMYKVRARNLKYLVLHPEPRELPPKELQK